MDRLKGRKIVIVGGTSGIGLASAKMLAKAGGLVTVAGRDKEAVAKIAAETPELAAKVMDAGSSAALDAFFKTHGQVDDLVLTVSGAKGAGPSDQLSLDDLLTGFQEKFFTQVRTAQAALPHLASDASITFVSAISARAANPATAGLAAINGAIEAMIKPLAKELQPKRVNAVSPGVVETGWWDKLPPDVRADVLKRSSEASLVGRNGKAEDLAEAIAFVVQNSFVTGTVLEVDGGSHLN